MGKTTPDKARESRRKHYYANKQAHYDRNKITEDKLRAYMSQVKASGCSICGEKEECCLDFHHLRDKDMHVSRLAKFGSLKRLVEEIQKCVVLCSNCHRKVHAGLLNIDTGVA